MRLVEILAMLAMMIGALICILFIYNHAYAQQGVRVIDGDTLVVNGEHIRLDGIDAPELDQTCTLGDRVYDCGRYSRQTLVELIGGLPINCTTSKKDHYGRWIGRCGTSRIADLGRVMVRQGWALAYRKYSSAYIQDEEQARADRLGVWSYGSTIVNPWDWRHMKGSALPR